MIHVRQDARRSPDYWAGVADEEARAIQRDYGVPDDRMTRLLCAFELAHRPPEQEPVT